MEFLKKMKASAAKLLNPKDKKRAVENLGLIIIMAIVLLITAKSLFRGNNKKNEAFSQPEAVQSDAGHDYISEAERLERELEKILSSIKGCGKVEVMVTLETGREKIPYYDTRKSVNDTVEKDSAGGTRSISSTEYESSLAYEEGNRPVILKEVYPHVKGVVVVAEGASNGRVKEDLIMAVKVLFDIPVHKIQVFERKK